MQAILDTLPEFDLIGTDTKTSPEFGTRRITGRVLGADFRKLHFKHVPRFNYSTLPRNRGSEAAAQWPAREISVRFRRADFGNSPRNPHLASERRPKEHQSGPRIRFKFPAFPALVIREKNEAALVHPLEQYHARRRFPCASGGRERHRRGFRQTGGLRGIEPRLKLPDRVAIRGPFT